MKNPKPDHRPEIEAIYADLERRPLPRQCEMRTGCCHFRLAGHTPMLTLGEALYAAQGVRASGRKALKLHPDGACPLLGRDGRCTIYKHRPFGCRTHFCAEAGGMYPRKHVADLIQRLEALDERLGGSGSRPLEAAVTAALGGKVISRGRAVTRQLLAGLGQLCQRVGDLGRVQRHLQHHMVTV